MTLPTFPLLMPLLAVSFGYEPSSDAEVGYDYTVQVEPELLEQMQRREAIDIEANIPAEVTPIRRIRIVVGDRPLPKRLRSTPVTQTAFRQDIDAAASPSIELLAQTGPAGGFGRSATGFNTPQARTGATPAPSSSATVPSISTQYSQPASSVQSQLDAGFQAAEAGLNNTSSAVANTATSLQASGQGIVDFARENLGEFVAPTESQAAAARAAQPTVTRTGAPPAPTAATGFDSSRYSTPTGAASASSTVAPGETSLLAQPRQATAPQAAGLSQAEREYLNRIERDRNLQQQAALASQRDAAARGSVFPDQPAMQPLPNRIDGVVAPLGRPSTGTETAGLSGGPAIPAPNTGSTAWGANQGPKPKNAEPPPIGTAPPAITTVKHTPAPTAEDEEVASWLKEQELNKEASSTQESGSSNTPVWLLGWTIAIGSVVTNLFQWLNIVDMRNKYRVALRRNSPNFSRSMAA